MDSGNLTHLIYTSSATRILDASDLKTVLEVSRRWNSDHDVTGMLLHISGSFFQVLKGDEATLMGLFVMIGSDPRHRNVTKIIHEPIASRAFGDWRMGFAEVDPSELASIDGLSDFFHGAEALAQMQPGRAKKILTAFAQGRWRAHIQGRG